jgi:hypothetical protein
MNAKYGPPVLRSSKIDYKPYTEPVHCGSEGCHEDAACVVVHNDLVRFALCKKCTANFVTILMIEETYPETVETLAM